jgi:PAS domain S-box-containing protein
MERIHLNIGDWAAVSGAKVTRRLLAAVNHTNSLLHSTRERVATLARRAKTAPARLQQALREKENHLEKLLADSPEPMVVTDDARSFIAANPAALDLFGVSKANIRKFTIDAFLLPRHIHCFERGGPPFVMGTVRLGECEIRRLDGKVKVVDFIFQTNFTLGRHLAKFQDVDRRNGKSIAEQRESAVASRFPHLGPPSVRAPLG